MSDVTIEDVDMLNMNGWNQLNDEKKEAMLDIAKREANQKYSGRMATLSIIDGNKDDFITYLAAHKWTLASGGESQSESSAGGSVNWNNPQGDAEMTLLTTRFGRTAYSYLRNNQSYGVVRYK